MKMYNTDLPTRAELPSTQKLIRSTLLSIVAAIAILISIILPSEYGIDPLGTGRAFGLTEMGEIKVQLAKEAEADRMLNQPVIQNEEVGEQSSLFDTIFSGLFIKQAAAQTAEVNWKDEISITLEPGQGAEVKLVMAKGAIAEFTWIVDGGVANYDLHGDGGGQSISYEKGRGVPGETGSLEAAFDGNHGWFWRNRDKQDITVILRVKGDYTEMKRPI